MEEHAISFGTFRLLAAERLVLEGDKPVRIGSRAFDILAALVERAGEVVSKEELIARAWPQTFVEESNLKIQISALRRALGDGQSGRRYILTVPGRGYNFVAPVILERAVASQPAKVLSPPAHNLPVALTRMIGRDETVSALLSRLSDQRLVTIVGPGGIGKTTVALAVAERVITSYEDGVWLIDLAPLDDPRLVPSALATVLGQKLHTADPLPGLIASLRDKRTLLVLDNCERVVDAVAGLAATVLSGVHGVNILATSREPLGVVGEHTYRLGPLKAPQSSLGLTAIEAATFPAVQLFIERVCAIVEDFTLTDANTPAAIEICQKLDGLPLAIEFAAPRVEVLGVDGLAARLDKSLPLLGARRPSAMPRHRTISAVLDWSYGLLSEREQLLFRALSIFNGTFAVEAATAVAMHALEPSINAIDRLADLAAKSLLVADVSGANPRFRLLHTTRTYALEKLDESGERDRIALCHAVYYRSLFERAEEEVAARPANEWLADYAREIDNLRAALDWAFSPGGEMSIGIALTSAAAPLWMRLSLAEECRQRAKQALSVFPTTGNGDPYQEMRLHAVLGGSTMHSLADAPLSDMGAAFTKTLQIAESLGDTEYKLRGLRGLYVYHMLNCSYRDALPFAQAFNDLTVNGSDQKSLGEYMIGVVKHFLGDHVSARRHYGEILNRYAASDHGRGSIRSQDIADFGMDLRVSVRVWLARVLWLQGLSDQAVRAAETSIGEAEAIGHTISLCHALAFAACPIALWVGNLAAARHYAGMLVDHSRKHSLPLWSVLGSKLQTVVVLKSDDFDAGLRLPPAGFDGVAEPNLNFLIYLSEQAEALAHAGRIAEALALVEAGIERSKAGWLTPELLRLKGELLLLHKTSTAAETAENLFVRALGGAREQDALSWELRAATSLARLLHHQGHTTGAQTVLQPVYARFSEGFDTFDLIAAKRLLDEL
jgi:predicted ATPase/DNA-binding winged helix-turn-helix (wHTH) protein